jgi:transglutaminase-like putative cysteine protease
MLSRIVLAAALVAAVGPGAVAAERGVSTGPVPPCVDEPEVAPAPASAPTADLEDGVRELFFDRQVCAVNGYADYKRRVRQVATAAGTREVAELNIGFDPTWQTLRFHHVRVVRDGHPVGSFSLKDVKVIQQESELSRRIYNGSLNALVFLRDVRVGDVIDYAYSHEGADPLLEGKVAVDFDLGYSVPLERLRQRITLPRGRAPRVERHVDAPEPEVREVAAGRQWTWDLHGLKAIHSDGDLPRDFEVYPWVQMTEFENWAQVAAWSARLFDIPGDRSTVAAQAARFAREPTTSARALAAIRFVQDEVRYLGMEMGRNSHAPHPPAEVLARRFGDCKDKALLLATLLRDLGFQARPVLVRTVSRRGLDAWAPTPFAFDHAIVEAHVDGRTLWVDATASEQGGPLSVFERPPFLRVLPVDAGAEGLIRLEAPPLAFPTRTVDERYVVSSWEAPARLQVETTYRGSDANYMRGELGRSSREETRRSYLDYYAKIDRDIRSTAPLAIHDDRDANELKVVEQYEIPDFWDGTKRELYGWAIRDQLVGPRTTQRTMPLGVRFPVRVEHRLHLVMPAPVAAPPLDARIDTPASHFEGHAVGHGSSIDVEYSFESRRDSLPAADVGTHLAQLDEIKDQLSYVVDHSRRPPPPEAARPRPAVALPVSVIAKPRSSWWTMAGMFTAAGLIGLTVRLTRRRVPVFEPGGGDAPAHALPIAREEDAHRLFEQSACACGAPGAPAEESHFATYAGRRLTVLSRLCTACGQQHAIYFSVASS